MMWITERVKRSCLVILLLIVCFCQRVLSTECNITIHINSTNPEGVLSSPSFPGSYDKLPEGYTCWLKLVPDDPTRHLQITFEDFHLSGSLMTSCDSGEMDTLTINSPSKTWVNCGCQRPHVLDLTGQEIRFELLVQAARTSDASSRFYGAKYKYLTPTEYMELRDVYFYSDSTKLDIGNGYKLSEWPANALPTFFNSEFIDVLYYIEAAPGMKISVAADFVTNRVGTSVVVIRDGITSQAAALYEGSLDTKASVISSQESMYIRWYGLIQDSRITLRIEVTAFRDPVSANNCGSSDYFYCTNNRCIKTSLTCDSIDNCGDGSDETMDSPEDICHGDNNCDSSPCLNGGTCSPVTKPSCLCPGGYWGDICEFDNTTSNTDYTDLQHTSIMIGAFVGAVCLLSICWLIAMARKRQYDEPNPRIQRIVSVHSRDERGMRPSVTATGAIDLPPTYSDCVNETGTPKVGKRGDVHTITEESLDDTDGDVFTADDEGPPLSPPPAYESVALSEEDEDGISFQVTGSALPDVVNQDRVPQRLTSNHLDTEV
ncbi:neuropilin and tolloid-like protein 2 isoform X5 [Asterias rubens]|uniref:neuropilin and tolloid-like protein 2 isoform X5 n=1 Tax=Asterias rubens TaxID=7604 RepID=UPI0014555D76|nr:neuropilin and tolloid-like protein 2 isoform X5 [Asterias rubens]